MQNDRLCSHLSAQWFHLIFKLDIIVNSWSCSWLISPRTEYAAFLDFDPHRTYFETIQGSFSLNELQSAEFQLKDFTAPYFIWWGYSLSELWLVYVVCHVCWNASDLHRRENNRREQTHCLYIDFFMSLWEWDWSKFQRLTEIPLQGTLVNALKAVSIFRYGWFKWINVYY